MRPGLDVPIAVTRDPYTAGHQKRVALLAVAIASELGLPKEEVHGIHLAASIHDLGKIQVPAEILSKPGKIASLNRRIWPGAAGTYG